MYIHLSQQILILETLHWCFQVDTSQGLHCKTIAICTGFLGHKFAKLRGRAARIIFDLTVPYEGKETACDSDSIPALVELLRDEDSFVRSQAAAALMRYCVPPKVQRWAAHPTSVFEADMLLAFSTLPSL